jgi:GNAT superfamily N-acetyltransferase
VVNAYKNPKQEGYQRKASWLKQRFAEGMKCKGLYSPGKGIVGYIEYIPGERTWRAIEADGYMAIHCIFNIYRQHQRKGYGSLLVQECLSDAQKAKMHGAAVVIRKGTWMVGKELFLKNGFEVVDTAPPDFELLVKKFDPNAPSPKFKGGWAESLNRYGPGLTIIYSYQCPYVAKAIREIGETAQQQYGLKPDMIELSNCREAQDAPTAYGGVFSLIYNGKLLADHVISNTRFKNIMNKELK